MMHFKELNIENSAEEEMEKDTFSNMCTLKIVLSFLYALTVKDSLPFMYSVTGRVGEINFSMKTDPVWKKCKFHYSYITYKFTNQKTALVSLYDSLVSADRHRCNTCMQPSHRRVCNYN